MARKRMKMTRMTMKVTTRSEKRMIVRNKTAPIYKALPVDTKPTLPHHTP